MSSPILLMFLSLLIVSLVSLIGVLLIGLNEDRINRILFVLISFAVGGLLGDVFIHILPKMVEGGVEGFPTTSLFIVLGIILSFILEKIIHWRHSHTIHHDEHHHMPLGTLSLIGDAAHNFTDGILIAGSYLVSIPTGIATTVAVILHEIPQEIGDFAILLYSGYAKRKAILFNLLTALSAFMGAFLVLALRTSVPDLESYLLPIIAGNFLYIAVADLIPELHKQTRLKHSLVQLLGVGAGYALMFLLTFLE